MTLYKYKKNWKRRVPGTVLKISTAVSCTDSIKNQKVITKKIEKKKKKNLVIY